MADKDQPFWRGEEKNPAELPKAYYEKPILPLHQRFNSVDLTVHLNETRERTAGMSPEERAWRKRWIMDQKLTDLEPLNREIRSINPLRKLYRLPMDLLEMHVLRPKLGWYNGWMLRHTFTKAVLLYCGVLVCWYAFKYQRRTWESYRGVTVVKEQGHRLQFAEEIEKEYPGLIDKAIPHADLTDRWQFRSYNARSYIDTLDLEPPARP